MNCTEDIVKKLRESREPSTEYIKKVEDILNNQLFGYELSVKVESLEIISETPTKITFKVDYQVTISIPYYDEESGREYKETEEEYRSRSLTLDKADLEESTQYQGYDIKWVNDPQGGKHVDVYDKDKKFKASYEDDEKAKSAIDSGEIERPETMDESKYLSSSDRDVMRAVNSESPSALHWKNGSKVKNTKTNKSAEFLGYKKDFNGKYKAVFSSDGDLFSYSLGDLQKDIKDKVLIKESESIDLSVGSTFKNAGLTWEILAKKGDYTLVYAANKKWNPYVVAWKLQDDGSWGQGHYFDSEDKAKAYFNKKA